LKCAKRKKSELEGDIMGTQRQAVQIYYALLLAVAVTFGAYPIVDTGQEECYDNTMTITPPSPGAPFFGQDAQFDGNIPSYTLSGDGLTVYDNVTGLTWQRSPDSNGDGEILAEDKFSYSEALDYPAVLNSESFGGYSDWRVPTIKELYSLIKFNGQDISGYTGSMDEVQPFIDNDYFDFAYGDTLAGERLIDMQYATTTIYNETTIPGVPKMFGVIFADGRIKGYDTELMGTDKLFGLICVRGNPDYGVNDFLDNGDGTITDSATNLMWQRGHSSGSLSWQDALEYAETLTVGGYDDWRLPNAKELQSIVDYTRSPGTTGAAIDPIFECDAITNEAGGVDYPWFWTGTTHGSVYGGNAGVYVAFGRASGWMQLPGRTYYSFIDVHGAGAQRSDPKSGSPTDYYLGVDSLGNPVYGHGPQGDNIRVENYVRCVRDVESVGVGEGRELPKDIEIEVFPNPFNSSVGINVNGVVTKIERLEIYDVTGVLLDYASAESRKTGHFRWQPGETLESGVYFVRARIDDYYLSTRIIYLK
jgi:hypothetical protein